MNTKTWIIFGVIVVAIFGGLIYISKKDQVVIDVSKVDVTAIQAASAQNGNIAEHVTGNPNSKVRIVEYGDIQCPACGGAHPGLKKVTEDYGDKIGFVFRNFPLTSIHPNALASATVVEAAGLQGKYWEMNNLLYGTQSSWSNLSSDDRTGRFNTYAQQLKLDMDKFKKDLESSSISQKISYDQALGRKQGVTGTPSIFVNGEKLSDSVSGKLVQGDAKPLRDLLDAKLKENGIEPPTATN